MPAAHDSGVHPSSRQLADELQWLGVLARRVALNRDDAEDLVQETWLAAEQSTSVPTRSKRAWLGGVLRNRERMHRRGSARRRQREDRAAEYELEPSPELEIHRQRVLAAVREALDELDEGDRQLLLARYCDEHAASTLAERLGIPASTVRSRLSRATARVRRSLDERWGGDRGAWAPAVLAIPQTAPPKSPASIGWKALLVAVMSKKIVVGVVAVLAAALWWTSSRNGTPTATATAEPTEDTSALAARRHAARSENPPDARPGTVTGQVLDADTQKPLAGSVILLAPASGSTALHRHGKSLASIPRTRTNADGEFSIEDVPAGRYRITATALGYLPARRGNLEVRAGDDPSSTVLKLSPGGNLLEGTISDIGGGPVEGALVRVQKRDGSSSRSNPAIAYGTMSDDEGHYQVTVPDGYWNVTAGGQDYTEKSRRVRLKKGPGRADFSLVPGATIHGRVVSEAGKPVPGARVGFDVFQRVGAGYSMRGSKPHQHATTDDQGRFELSPLEPGEYTLFANAKGLASSAPPVVLAALAEEVTGIEVVMVPAYDASGFIVDSSDDNKGIGGVDIVAMTLDQRQLFAVTQPDGYFELHGLTPGSHMVAIEGPGVIPSAFEHSVNIEDHDVNDLLFEVERGQTVRGRIEPPMAGNVKVDLRRSKGGLEVMLQSKKVAHTQTPLDDSGTFVIEGVPAGEWKVVATGEDGSRGEVEFELGQTDVDGIVIDMASRASVSGRVVDSAGNPVAGLTVGLQKGPDPTAPPSYFNRQRLAQQTTTGIDGAFEMQGVNPSAYEVVVRTAAGQPGEISGGPRPIDTTDGGDVRDLELTVALPDGRVWGRVLGTDQQPIVDAWVTLRRDRDSTHAITDADGIFEFTELADESYTVFARGPDADTKASAEDVRIGEPIDLSLEALGEIRGVVTRGGEPVPEFIVRSHGGPHERSVRSADGSFLLQRLEPGTQKVTVTTKTGSAYAAVELEPGGSARVELAVAPWGSVEGTLVSATDGTPLAGISFAVHAEGGEKDRERNIVSMLAGGGTTTDDQGHFSIDGIGGGKVTLRFKQVDGMRSQVSIGKHEFTLEGGEHQDLGTLQMLPTIDREASDRGRLGLSATVRRPEAVAETEPESAVWISWVDPAGPAAKAGLRVNDRVLAVNDIDESKVGYGTLREMLTESRIEAGKRYTLRVTRSDGPATIRIEAAPEAAK